MKTFIGGAHPPDNKFFTENKPLKKSLLFSKAVIHLSQHIGAPALSLVEKGRKIKTGELIGGAASGCSANIHSSVTGEVESVSLYNHPCGVKQKAIVVKTEDDKFFEDYTKEADYSNLTKEDIIQKIKEKGIVGLGGAAFPTHIKYTPPAGKNIKYLIINGVECEPYLTADHRLMIERTEGIIKGIEILMKAAGVEKCFVGIESNKPGAIRIMTQKCPPYIEVVPLKLKYPQGAEKQLIWAVLKEEVPPRKLPIDIGVVVQNIATAFAVYEAVAFNKPLYERAVTVSGTGINIQQNFFVRIGTLISDIIKECGGMTADIKKIITGGPMMGQCQASADAPLVKAVSGILFFTPRDQPPRDDFPCIRCGKCVDVCPLWMSPCDMGQSGESGDLSLCEHYGVIECCECGTCAYVCPSNRPLVQLIKKGKAVVNLKNEV